MVGNGLLLLYTSTVISAFHFNLPMKRSITTSTTSTSKSTSMTRKSYSFTPASLLQQQKEQQQYHLNALGATNSNFDQMEQDYENELYASQTNQNQNDDVNQIEEVDVAIVGAGIGGLCAGAILNTLYNKKVGIYESHYLPGKKDKKQPLLYEIRVTFHFSKQFFLHILMCQIIFLCKLGSPSCDDMTSMPLFFDIYY